MNWKTSAQQLAQLLETRGIQDQRVLQRFAEVPRHLFVPAYLQSQAYEDYALDIGSGQTISQPYIVALMTEAAAVDPGDKVLEIGTGSGYQAAILATLCRHLVTLERIPELAATARVRWSTLKLTGIESHVSDGTRGWPDAAPYHAILVTAGTPRVPQALLDQLAEGGRLIVPEGPADHQELRRYRRQGDRYVWQHLCDCRFVKLKGEQGWPVDDELAETGTG